MNDHHPRQYLEDVPTELQDMIYDRQLPEAISFLMTHQNLGRMQAAIEVKQTLARMQASFPGCLPDEEELLDSDDEMPPVLKALFLWGFTLFFLVAGASATYFGGRGALRAKASTEWPSAEGKILKSSVEREVRRRKPGDKNAPLKKTVYRARIAYAYSVDGESFEGTRVAYGDHGKSNSGRIGIGGFKISTGGNASAHAQSIVDLYPAGKTVAVYYMPGNPKECLLQPGLALQALAWPVVGVILLLLGCVLLYVALRPSRN